ncbi:MAG: aromatic ring-hydroxylating dioxygenase subunit alpha [Gammaproteobacteria bacterium]|nr:MAG: aromatic ring-hydroxylating dioxygenase subunit alpha [Gammaproteobacteria bacterium]
MTWPGEAAAMSEFHEHHALREHWHAVATEHELLGGPVGRTVLGDSLVLYLDENGEAVAAEDRCPHREAPLSEGRIEDGRLVCPYHGWSFGAGGRCARIPSADPSLPLPRNGNLRTVHVTRRYGLVWVCLADVPGELPVIRQDVDPAFRRINSPVEHWQACALRMTDNFLDIAHFPWVHTGTFGNSQRTEVGRIELEMLDDGYFGYAYDVEAENPLGATLVSGQKTSTVLRRMTTGFKLPFAVRSTILYETGLEHIILLLSTPVDAVRSLFTFVVWRNDDFRVSAEEAIAFDRMIGAEDKRMLERIPGVLPLTSRALASTQSDKASTAWRLQFAKLLGLSQHYNED